MEVYVYCFALLLLRVRGVWGVYVYCFTLLLLRVRDVWGCMLYTAVAKS